MAVLGLDGTPPSPSAQCIVERWRGAATTSALQVMGDVDELLRRRTELQGNGAADHDVDRKAAQTLQSGHTNP